MFILRFLWAVLTSRWLWTLIGITLLSLVIWVFGPIVKVGAYGPFASENVRIVIIALLVIFWLIWLIVAQRRAIRANRMFVAEIAAPVVEKPLSPGEENVAAVGAKFAEVMAELKRRRLGGRKF
ncbi:MAG: type VI secretion system membrane subunit TssM, partial [Mesorhizobium sp.]